MDESSLTYTYTVTVFHEYWPTWKILYFPP